MYTKLHYISLSNSMRELIPIRRLLKEIGEKLREEAEKMEADAEIKTNKRYALLVDGQTLVHILPNKDKKNDIGKDKNKGLLYQVCKLAFL